MKLYSQMTHEELLAEISKLHKLKEEAEFPSHMAVINSKIVTAQSYMLSKEQFQPGLYKVAGHEQLMSLTYVNGVMAWGIMNDEEVSFPLALLKKHSETE